MYRERLRRCVDWLLHQRVINLPAFPGWRWAHRCLNPNTVTQRPAGQTGTWHGFCSSARPAPEEKMEIHTMIWWASLCMMLQMGWATATEPCTYRIQLLNVSRYSKYNLCTGQYVEPIGEGRGDDMAILGWINKMDIYSIYTPASNNLKLLCF